MAPPPLPTFIPRPPSHSLFDFDPAPNLKSLSLSQNKIHDSNIRRRLSQSQKEKQKHKHNPSHPSNSLLSKKAANGHMTRKQARKNPTSLCIDDFHCFFDSTLVKLVPDKDTLLMLQNGLHELSSGGDGGASSKAFSSALAEIEVALLTVLQNCPTLPSYVIADIHTYLGLIYQARENFSVAQESFLRALWIRSSMLRFADPTHCATATNSMTNSSSRCNATATTTTASSTRNGTCDKVGNQNDTFLCMCGHRHAKIDLRVDIALAEHRLGLVAGKNGHYVKAIEQLEQAIESYKDAHVGISEGCYVMARTQLHEFQEQYQLSLIGRNKERASTSSSQSFALRRNTPT